MQTSCTAKVCEGQRHGAPLPLTTAYLLRAGRGRIDWLTFMPLTGRKIGGTRAVWLKRLLMLKVVVLLLLATCLQAGARGYSQGVTLTAKDSPLKTVFQKITEQTGYPFLYNDQALEKTKLVTISIKNATLEQAMDQVLKGQPLTYSIVNKTIIVRPKTGKRNIDDEVVGGDAVGTPIDVAITVKGRVVDENGEPVAGATVVVKGTNNAISTNANGEFVLNGVAADAVLVITGVNIQPYEIKVDGRTNISISVQLSITARETVKVVHTGYQRISKEKFVGSYAQLDSVNFHRRAGMGIIERLDGTVPGVLFNKKGSSNYSAILIRGISTLGQSGTSLNPTSTEPLIVVDNFPMPPSFNINNINPNDVESVTVLKDAAAASIWGARAGNGVIVITTKKGRFNQRFQIDASSNITVEQKPDLYYYKQISPSDYIDIEKDLFNQGAYDPIINDVFRQPVLSPVVEILDSIRRNLLSQATGDARIDAMREYDLRQQLSRNLYRQALRQQYYIGISGGTNSLAYKISGGYNRSLNNIQGSEADDQFTINTNTAIRPVKNLEILAGIDIALIKNASASLPNLPNYPYGRLADNNGNALAIPLNARMSYVDTVGGGELLDWHYRPLDEIRNSDNSAASRFIRLNIGASYQFTSWLKGNINYQYQNTNIDDHKYYSLETYTARNLINTYTNLNQVNSSLRYPVPMGGILDLSQSLVKDYNLRGTINVDKSFGQHQVNAILGGEVYDSKGGYSNSERIYGYNDQVGTYTGTIDYSIPYPGFYAPSAGNYSFIPNQNFYLQAPINRTVSALANASYTYKSRYTLYASARRDGANIFGVRTNNRWKPLWSVGAGWELSKEGFYQISWLPYLKLRGSYGYAGNANNSLSGRFTINYSLNVDPFTSLAYSRPNLAPNFDLKWEEVRITNMGLDFRVLQNRISGSFEIYQKKSTDVIAQAPMPPSSGVSTFVKNYANMKTNGYEIALNSQNSRGEIEWTSNFGWSHAKTIVTKLFTTFGSRVKDYLNYNLNAVPGQVIYGLSSYKWAGLDPITGDPQGYLNNQVSKNYNSILNDSIQNQIFHGSSLPLDNGYLRNNVSWRGITLSINITGRFNYYFREPAINISSPGASLSAEYYNRWQKPGDETLTDIPSISYTNTSGQRNEFYQFASIHVKKADNIRVQDIRLSYQWNNKGNNKIPFQSIHLFFYPNNLNWILWRAEASDWDPDFSGGASAIGGIDAPTPKTWTTGVTINFK